MIIDGKTITLKLDLDTYDALCQKGYWIEEIDDTLKGANQVQAVCDLIAIMGTHGTGEEIKPEWVREKLPFARYMPAKNEIVTTIVAAMRAETAEAQKADDVVDEVLEEIEKKKEKIG